MDQIILSMSPAAKRWLDESQLVHVLHVFDPVCNLINEEGEVFSLVGPIVGNGPFSAVLERGLFSSWILAESKVQISANAMQIDETTISYENARMWDPRPNWASLENSSKQLLGASDSIERLLREHAPVESFAHIVLPFAQSVDMETVTQKKVKSAIMDLLPAILGEDRAAMQSSAAALGGLGAGLTPAGDDFLVGLIHALWATGPQTQALALSLILAEAAVPRTNSLSGAWLRAASQGEAGEPWHELVAAIAGDKSDDIEKAVMRILPTGHSSGADALGGFVTLIRLIISKDAAQ